MLADIQDSLFKVRAADCEGGVENRRLTGFAMDGVDGIVTALHGVVGCRTLTAQKSGSGDVVVRNLIVTQVDLERDVAIVNARRSPLKDVPKLSRASELDRPSGLKAWGFPMDVREPFDTSVTIRSVQFTSWSEMTPDARAAMQKRGSPMADVRMLSIQGPLTPGLSGSPILNDDGAVVGITNGGLAGGAIDVALAAPVWDLSFRPAAKLQGELKRLGSLDASALFGESTTAHKTEELARMGAAFTLQAQAEGLADQARTYVNRAIEPVQTGDGTAWWPINLGLFDTLKRVRFHDRRNGWVLGTKSFSSTSDSGISWAKQQFENVHLNDFAAADSQSVWLVGNDGLVFHRAGARWSRQETGTSNHIYGVDFLANGSVGWAVGDRGLVLFTADGGKSWRTQASGTDRSLITVHAFDSRIAWIGGASITLLTDDGGSTWRTIETDKTFTNVQFFNRQSGISIENNLFYRTSDGARSWLKVELNGPRVAVRGFSFPTPQKGWAGNLYGEVFRTQDGGATWSTLRTGARRLNDVHFVDESSGWAVGDDGIVMHTAPLAISVEGKKPPELLFTLRSCAASEYFHRQGILTKLEKLVEDYEALVAAHNHAVAGELREGVNKAPQP